MSIAVPVIAMIVHDKPVIAIVDDDASVCRSLKRLLQVVDLEVEIFGSGQDFLDRMAKMPSSRPDCLVLDVHMPGMGGIEVQKRLSQSASSLPIIFITAHDEETLRHEALKGGAIAFLQKPFDDKLFLKTVDGALKRRAGKAQLGSC